VGLELWFGLAWDFQAGLAQTINDVFDLLRFVPLCILVTRRLGEVRAQRQQLLQCFLRCLMLAELAESRGTRSVGVEVTWRVDSHGSFERRAIFVPVICAGKDWNGVPPRMVRVQLHGRLNQRATTV